MRTHLLLSLIVSLVVFSSVSNAAWQVDGIGVSTSTNYETTQSMTPDDAGGMIVTWHAFRAGTGYDVFAQRISAAGDPLWTTNGVVISGASRDQASPTIIADGAGGAIITWLDDRNCCFNYDIFAQRIDASGVVQWTANGVAICTAAKDQIAPQIVPDGAGGAIIVWEDGRISGLNRDVFAQRINGAGTVQWTANGVALCTASNNQYLPKIISDDAGGAIATWHDFRVAGVPDIFVQRIDGTGAVQWTANGVKLTAFNSEYSPAIDADGAGGAIVSWQDFRTGSGDVFVQRVNAAGVPQWTPNGVKVSAARWDVNGDVASDGTGGAILTWHSIEDEPDAFEYDIFAQRVDATGAIQWGDDGVTISDAEGNQVGSTLIPDGVGGAVIAWEDSVYTNSSNYDIRAQRIDASGVPQWTAGGVSVCTADNEQHHPVLLPDESGGAFVSWEDFRNGSNTDIFALHIGADGTIPTGIGDTPRASAIALTSNYPNPFSARTAFDLDLAIDANVVADVFDVAGRRVRHIELGRLSAGSRAMSFDGIGENGRLLPSGVYFYRITANGASVTQKMVIAR
jgi:hypothetical protein